MPCGSSKESSHQDKNGENGHCAFEDLDHSALQQPLNLGVTNVRQILKCIQSGSREIKDIILNECNVIYECKVCVGLFRSLANFMYHKRCYCKKHCCEEMVLFENFEEAETVVVQPEAPENTLKSEDIPKIEVIDLTKGDLAEENKSETLMNVQFPTDALTNPKDKNTSSNNEGKEKSESEKADNPMISRRTRDKNAQNLSSKAASKITLRTTSDEPPLKCAKIISAKIIRKEPEEKCSPASGKKDNQSDALSKEVKSKKIEISKLAGSLEKNIPSFPKIIFKAIDSNPHAVYQSNDKKKLDTFGVGNNYDNSTVETKVDNEKLIIVLKKGTKSDESPNPKSPEPSKPNDTEKISDFRLARRKRLMPRKDCNVDELRCLTCKTQFTTLKTLYYHMLSLHSKKRLYYPCPFCETLFVQMYGVTRHLISIHNKSKDQINKLRDIIKKKSVWKRIDDVNPSNDSNISPINYQIKTDEPEIKIGSPPRAVDIEDGDTDSLKTVIRFGKNVTLHQCTKCSRVFGRKSSQVSHQKFCIMNNSVKVEGGDPVSPSQSTNSSVLSFLSASPKTSTPKSLNVGFDKSDIQISKSSHEKPSLDMKMSIRPKRGAEKQMHKDFVNSQTLKWRSANRVDTNANSRTSPPVKKGNGKNLEKKVLSIMDSENLTCLKCNKKFSSYSNLRRHVAIHVGWTRFKCKYCDYQAYNKSQCWSHIQKAHSVDENDIEKSIVHLGNNNNNPSIKKPLSNAQGTQSSKRNAELAIKNNSLSKVKVSKKKNPGTSKNNNSEKKQLHMQKKELLDIQQEVEKEQYNETEENKKEKSQLTTPVQKISKKELTEGRKEKPLPTISIQKFLKKEVSDTKKEKPQHIIPIQKLSIPDYKRETNYKSVTTSNPTTIILSKKIPSSTVQSIVTISPESVSSTSKISPIRTSPRKNEIKSPGERLIKTLPTRSSAYSKNTPIQIKLPARSSSVEGITNDSVDKNCSKKDRLISEWFPKKDLSSTSVRRDSAPLIIGLVPAPNAGVNACAKNSTVAFERLGS